MRQLTNVKTVPVTLIGDQLVVGWNQKAFAEAIAEAFGAD